MSNGSFNAYAFAEWIDLNYSPYHGKIQLCVCSIGLTLNIISIIVFLRKEMKSQTNSILLGISIADMLTMVIYLVYDIFCMLEFKDGCNYFSCIVIAVCMSLIIGCHSTATLLTVFLAAFRCLVLYKTSQKSLPKNLVNIGLGVSTVFGILMSLPNFGIVDISLNTARIENGTQGNETNNYMYSLETKSKTLEQIYFMVYGAIIKLISCALIIVFTIIIVIILFQTKKRQLALCNRNGTETTKLAQEKLKKKMRQSHRTTIMLIFITISFAISEAPQGVITILSVTNEDFMNNFYVKSGSFLDIIIILNSACTFFLYCAMSEQFKDNFKKIFLPCIKPRETNASGERKTNLVDKKNTRHNMKLVDNLVDSKETIQLNNVRKEVNENGYLLINPNADQNSIMSIDI